MTFISFVLHAWIHFNRKYDLKYYNNSCISQNVIIINGYSFVTENPKFSEPITNVTVAVGREAILVCLVEDLGAYKVRRMLHIAIAY